jgi:transposase-like protein
MMAEYADSFRRQAVARAREIGTRPAARELGLGPKTLRLWRRNENRAETRAGIAMEIEQLEREIDTADDLATIAVARERLDELARRLGYDPELLHS